MKDFKQDKTSVYQFLEQSGILATGTDEEITVVRKRYWLNYKKNWQKQKRVEQREFTVFFTKQEMRILQKAAEQHELSFSAFIKHATLAYIQKTFVVLHPSVVNHIRELLIKNYTILQNIEDSFISPSTQQTVVDTMGALEETVLQLLQNPASFSGV